MKITDEGPKPNRVWSLTISTLLSRRLFTIIVASLPNVKIIRKPKFFTWFKEDEFLEFTFKGVHYCAVIEEFSRNRFEIHPKPQGYKAETIEIKQHIENIRFPYILLKLF
ncbi:hypothetical protein [Aliikangiella sp. IMCC44359]|uniref:hypothetical protein n=1 Tax=Aliikangiella sp. IMCC44359 TaxID=3459125 RepID=UPI00403AA6CC